MRKYILSLLLLLPSVLAAQATAEGFLDRAVEAMKADAAVQMDYTYTVYDENGKALQADKGVMRLHGNCYSLLMNDMKVWCDGSTQWSYIREINEIYITDASSPEAQNLSPLFIMEMYRSGFNVAFGKDAAGGCVVLDAVSPEANINKVKLYFVNGSYRLRMMQVYMPGQGCVEVLLNEYTPGCKFPAGVYECPVLDFPDTEIIDMR